MKVELKLNVSLLINLADGETELPKKEQENIVNIVQDALMHQYGSAGITSDDYEGFCESVSTSVVPSNIVEIQIFKFDELSVEAKENARSKFKEHGLDEYQTKAITESFQHKLEKLGLPSEDIGWSLSYCQGDGVAFYGEVDLEDYIAKNKLEQFKPLIGNMYNVEIFNCNHRYHHYNTMSICYNFDGNSNLEELASKLDDHIRAHIKELSKEFEKSGYEQVDYYYSDEYIDDMIRANDYEFTEDGEIH